MVTMMATYVDTDGNEYRFPVILWDCECMVVANDGRIVPIAEATPPNSQLIFVGLAPTVHPSCKDEWVKLRYSDGTEDWEPVVCWVSSPHEGESSIPITHQGDGDFDQVHYEGVRIPATVVGYSPNGRGGE